MINNSETVDGYDGETDDELRERYYFKVREPVTSGNIYQWTINLKSFEIRTMFTIQF